MEKKKKNQRRRKVIHEKRAIKCDVLSAKEVVVLDGIYPMIFQVEKVSIVNFGDRNKLAFLKNSLVTYVKNYVLCWGKIPKRNDTWIFMDNLVRSI